MLYCATKEKWRWKKKKEDLKTTQEKIAHELF